MTLDKTPLLQRFLEGQASPEESAEFAAALASDPTLADELVDLVALEDHLQTYFAEQRHENFQNQLDHGFQPSAPLALSTASQKFWQVRPLSFFSVVAVLTIMAWGGFVLFLDTSREPQVPSPNVLAGAAEIVAPVVAQVMYGDQVAWEDASTAPAPGGFVRQGETLALKGGWVDLHLQNGVHLSLAGPAQLTLQQVDDGQLDFGQLLASVPSRAQGFTVRTPQADVVDLGTEFGVEADAAQLRVTVFHGRVETYLKGRDVPQPLAAGESWEVDAAGARSLAAAPSRLEQFREMRRALETPTGVRFRVSTLPPNAGDDSVGEFGHFEAGLNAGPSDAEITINRLHFQNPVDAASRTGVTILSNAKTIGVQAAEAQAPSWQGNLAELMKSWEASQFSKGFQVVVGGLEVGTTYRVVFFCAQPLNNTGFRVMHIASGKDQSPQFDASGARADLCPLYLVEARFTAAQSEQEFTLQGAPHSRSVLGGVAVFSLPKSPESP